MAHRCAEQLFNWGVEVKNVKNQVLLCNMIRRLFTPPLEIVLIVNAI